MKLYILLCNGCEWEDLVIFDNKEDALSHLQKIKELNYNKCKDNFYRLEIFEKDESNNFIPTYKFIT
jgi:hypothetical protein